MSTAQLFSEVDKNISDCTDAAELGNMTHAQGQIDEIKSNLKYLEGNLE